VSSCGFSDGEHVSGPVLDHRGFRSQDKERLRAEGMPPDPRHRERAARAPAAAICASRIESTRLPYAKKVTAAHDYSDLHQLIDRLEPEQADELRKHALRLVRPTGGGRFKILRSFSGPVRTWAPGHGKSCGPSSPCHGAEAASLTAGSGRISCPAICRPDPRSVLLTCGAGLQRRRDGRDHPQDRLRQARLGTCPKVRRRSTEVTKAAGMRRFQTTQSGR